MFLTHKGYDDVLLFLHLLVALSINVNGPCRNHNHLQAQYHIRKLLMHTPYYLPSDKIVI